MQADANQMVMTHVTQSQANKNYWTAYTAWRIAVMEAEERRRRAELEALIQAYYEYLRLQRTAQQTTQPTSPKLLGGGGGGGFSALFLGGIGATLARTVNQALRKNSFLGLPSQNDDWCENPYSLPFGNLLSNTICNTPFTSDYVNRFQAVRNSVVALNFVATDGRVGGQSLGTVVVINGQQFISTHDHFGGLNDNKYNNTCTIATYAQQFDHLLVHGNLGQVRIPISELQSTCQTDTGVQLLAWQNHNLLGITSSSAQISPNCNLNVGDVVYFAHIPGWNGDALNRDRLQLSSNVILSTAHLSQVSPNYLITYGQAGLGDSGGGLFNFDLELCGNLGFSTGMARGYDRIIDEYSFFETLADTLCGASNLFDGSPDPLCRYNVYYATNP